MQFILNQPQIAKILGFVGIDEDKVKRPLQSGDDLDGVTS